jgi:hypothetical protein
MPFGLVKSLMLRGYVCEKERIAITTLCLGSRSPDQFCSPCQMSTVELIVRIYFISNLEILVDAGIIVEFETLSPPLFAWIVVFQVRSRLWEITTNVLHACEPPLQRKRPLTCPHLRS